MTEPVLSIDSGREVHVLWVTIVWPLEVSYELFIYLIRILREPSSGQTSSPKVREFHDHCLNIMMERTGSDNDLFLAGINLFG